MLQNLLHVLMFYVFQVVTGKSLQIDVHIEYLQTFLDVLHAFHLLDCLLLLKTCHIPHTVILFYLNVILQFVFNILWYFLM